MRESIATIRAALDHGVNLIDTAPVYGFGRSEEIVGKALAGRFAGASRHRDQSRARMERRQGLPQRQPRAHQQEIEDSLRRLQTDRIDIYQLHWPDPKTPIEDTAEAMKALLDRGKIGAIGVSNFSVEQMERFRAVAPIHVLQPPYNLFEREIEAAILPYCRKHGIATFGYGALCRGLLSGRMRQDTVFDAGDLRRDDPKFKPPRFAAISFRRRAAGRARAGALRQARHSSGGALGAGSRRHDGALGRPPPRPALADRRGLRLVARCRRKSRDRPNPQRRRSPIPSALNSWRRRRGRKTSRQAARS